MPIVKEERNERGQVTYRKYSTGYWTRYEYDKKGRVTSFKNSKGYWEKLKYNENGKLTYYKNSDGDLEKDAYDENGRLIYRENQNGVVLDKRESKEHFKDLNEKNENQEIAKELPRVESNNHDTHTQENDQPINSEIKVKMVKMGADIDATRNHRIRGIVPTEDGKYLFIEITKADRVDKKYTNCKTMKEYRQKYPNPDYIRVDFCFRVDIPKEHLDSYSPEFKGFLYSHYDLAYTNENIVELLQRLNPNITEIELTDDNYIEKFCEERGFFKLYDDRLQHSFEPINIMSLNTLGNCNVKFLYTCFASDGTKYSEESSENFKINDLINEFGKEAIAPLVQSYTASRPFKNSEMKEKFLKFVKEILNEKNENQEIAFLFDGTKIGERSQSFNDGYVIINARTKDEAVETFKAQYGRGQHNEALCTEVVSDFNRVEQIKSSDLPCHNYIDLTKPQEQNQSNTEEQTDGRK